MWGQPQYVHSARMLPKYAPQGEGPEDSLFTKELGHAGMRGAHALLGSLTVAVFLRLERVVGVTQ